MISSGLIGSIGLKISRVVDFLKVFQRFLSTPNYGFSVCCLKKSAEQRYSLCQSWYVILVVLQKSTSALKCLFRSWNIDSFQKLCGFLFLGGDSICGFCASEEYNFFTPKWHSAILSLRQAILRHWKGFVSF